MDKNSVNKQSNRIVVIGLDSADFDLVQKWANEGRLPAMASLMARGSWGKLNSTADIGSASVWPSFFTGVSPARHCALGRHRLKSGTYRVIYEPDAKVVKREPFWLQLSRAGRRIAVVDVPRTYPIEGLNGIQLVDWGTHDKDWHTDSYPPELIKKIISRFGSYPISDPNEFVSRNTEINQLSEFSRALISGVEKKGLVSRYILNQESWDFFITMFSEPHGAGHILWHLMDENHPAYNSEIAKTLGNPILNVYTSIDSEISKLMDAVPGVTFLIVSPAGMGPNYTGSHMLPEILKRLGMVAGSIEAASDNIFSKALTSLANRVRKLTPASRWGPHAVKNIKGILPVTVLKAFEPVKWIVPKQTWDAWKSHLKTTGSDSRTSLSFCVPSDFNGAIRINLKGREPEGLVEPGAEYESLCSELIRELSQLINIDTGKKAVSEVLRVSQVYKGEYLDELPDIVVKWAGDAPINGLSSPRIGTVYRERKYYQERTGAHRHDGFLIAAGKHIAQERTLKGASIMDIAPTILYLMGEPVPRDMDGKVLLDIIEDEFNTNNPVSYE